MNLRPGCGALWSDPRVLVHCRVERPLVLRGVERHGVGHAGLERLAGQKDCGAVRVEAGGDKFSFLGRRAECRKDGP